MAVNNYRSMNHDLREGSTDGKYRKARPDTTPAPMMGEEIVTKERASLHPFYGYGFPTTEYPESARVTNTRLI
jgi:hypothetical protein